MGAFCAKVDNEITISILMKIRTERESFEYALSGNLKAVCGFAKQKSALQRIFRGMGDSISIWSVLQIPDGKYS